MFSPLCHYYFLAVQLVCASGFSVSARDHGAVRRLHCPPAQLQGTSPDGGGEGRGGEDWKGTALLLPPPQTLSFIIHTHSSAYLVFLHTHSSAYLVFLHTHSSSRLVSQAFRRQTSLFFKIVSGVKSHHSAPHLAQLLLRLDYNKHFSTRNPLASADRPAPPTQP